MPWFPYHFLLDLVLLWSVSYNNSFNIGVPQILSLLISLTASFFPGDLFVVVKSLSRVRLFATPWTVAYQAPPSLGFSRQEYWSELPFPSPGDLPDFSSVQLSSVTQSCLTLCDSMDWSITGFSVHHQLRKFAQTHVY